MKRLTSLALTILIYSGISYSQYPDFFLDAWIEKTCELPGYESADKPAGEATISIHVDKDSVIQKIGPYIFGNNAVNWAGKMQDDESVIENLRNLNPGVLRLPGGSQSDVYFWNAMPGEGPADLPPDVQVSVLHAGLHNENWAMTLEEYYELLEKTNSTASICVNYGYARYGTGPNPVNTAAHYAAEWVRFDNGRTKFWEIGNENFGSWEAGYQIDLSKNQDGQPEFITGQLYGKHCRVFIDSMRAAAAEIGSEIKIGVVAFDAEESYIDVETNWNEGMMPEVGDMADFYIVHSYFTPWNEDSDVNTILNTHDVPQKIMEVITNDVTDADMPIIPVALTEWNTRAINSMQQVSYINGMHSALVLGELVLNDYGFATRWDLANGWDNGEDHGMFARTDEPGVVLFNPRPAFFYMYYFQKYMGDRMVGSVVDGNEEVIAFASSFSSGECGIAVINKSTVEETAAIEIENFKPGSKYYYFALVGGDDNGDFSRKVFVNGQGPSGEGGGPDNYETLKAYASEIEGGIKVNVPPLSVIYVVAEKIPAPAYKYSKVDTNAQLISVEFTQGMIVPEDPTGFEISVNNSTNIDVTNITSVPADSTWLLIHLAQEIDKQDTIMLSYADGNLISIDSAALVEFSDTLVDNLLPGSYPRLLSVSTTDDGMMVELLLNKEMVISDTSIKYFELTLLGDPDSTLALSGLSINADNSNSLLITPDDGLYLEYDLVLSYTGTDVQSKDEGILQTFDTLPVINSSPGFPPEVLSAEVSNFGYSIDLLFDKIMDESSAASSSFTLMVNGDVEVIDSIDVVDNTLKIIPVNYIQHADTVKISYTGTDVISIDRGILQNFENLEVSNTLPESTIFDIPGRIDCEMFNANMGMILEDCSDDGGGQNLGYIDPGDWVEYTVNVTGSGLYTVLIRTASNLNGGELIIQTPDAAVLDLDTITLPPTGGWQAWATSYTLVNLEAGTQRLRLYALTAGYNLNWVQFETGNTIPLATVVGANSNSPGDIIEIHFDKELAPVPDDEEENFTVLVGDVANRVTATSLKNGTLTTLVLSLDNQLSQEDVNITASYSGGKLRALDNSPIVAFYDVPVENKVNGIESARLSEITLYPNPVSSHFSLEGMEKGDFIRMYDIFGREVLSRHVNQSMETISVDHLPSGLYVIKLNDVSVQRIIKE